MARLDGLRRAAVLFMLRVKLAQPAGMSNAEFYGVWEQEAAVGLELLKAGVIKSLYKVAGSPEAIGVVELDSTDDIDRALHGLPIWKLGYSHLAVEVEWTPLRPYERWADELKTLAPAAPM